MSQVILLSLTASLNPTLVAATTVMLLLDKPAKLMVGYLLGAYMTSITLGLVIVFSLSNSSATNTTENTVSPQWTSHWGRSRSRPRSSSTPGAPNGLGSAGERAKRQKGPKNPLAGNAS